MSKGIFRAIGMKHRLSWLYGFLILGWNVLFLPAYGQGTGTALQPVRIDTARTPTLPTISLEVKSAKDSEEFVLSIQILLLLTVLTLAPSILIMMTSFTRIIVVLHFLKQAMGLQTQPPSQILVGLALFLTFFIMAPVLDRANAEGLQPYLRDEITQQEAIQRMIQPFREFMLKRVREEDLALFVRLQQEEQPKTAEDVSIFALIPAFALSELRIGFQIGFLLFIPFLIIDMIIASILMSLGMFLLPPQMISLPLKILLFVLVDGWHLIVGSLLESILNVP